MQELWQELDPGAQNALLAAFWGAVLWFVQFVWTRIPELPALQMDTAGWVKRLVAFSAVVITAWGQSGGDRAQFVSLLIPMLTASQALHLWAGGSPVTQRAPTGPS